MKIVFIVPAADVRRKKLYRLGDALYGKTNSITGPLILGGILKKAGHQVEVYEELYGDLDFSGMADADWICLSAMTSNAVRAYQLADLFRQRYHRNVIMGGMHPSYMPDEAATHADCVIIGEAENVIVDVVEGRIKNRIVRAVPVHDLDSIPFPDYTILKTPCDAANVMTSRGCPFNCNFCTTSRMFYPYRHRSPGNVIEELKMYKAMGFKYVNFEDDNFTANKGRAKQILRKMIENKVVFRETFFFGRTDMANDDELLGLLRDAHLRRVLIGIESLNQKSQDYINKKQNIDAIVQCGTKLSQYKIKLIASLVLGLDTDGREDIRKGVQFSRQINAYQLQPAILTPYPGTPIYRQFESENRILVKDWQYYDMMNVVFKPNNLTPWALQKEFFLAIKKFYSFGGAIKMFRLYGADAGVRRLGLWLVIGLGLPFVEWQSSRSMRLKISVQKMAQ
jgi:radical SAM superfamily enzyme YgiQ (UPF0313 family)